MEIELRRIGHNPRLDENTFVANLFVNGEKAAVVNNKTGTTQYFATDEKGSKLISEAEEYLKNLPGEKKEVDGKEVTIKESLADRIDKLFSEYLHGIELRKFDKKVQHIQKRNIVIGERGRHMVTYPTKSPIEFLLQGGGKDSIIELLRNKVIPELKGNEQILNTNLPGTLLQEAGFQTIKEVKPAISEQEKKPVKKKAGLKP